MTPKRLYSILAIALLPGFALLIHGFIEAGESALPNLCLFKQVTGIPCPSCGCTRAVVALLHGQFHNAIMLNPLGFLVAFIMFSAPLWISYDLIFGRKTLLDFYLRIESIVHKPLYATMLTCIVFANWIWNIQKGI